MISSVMRTLHARLGRITALFILVVRFPPLFAVPVPDHLAPASLLNDTGIDWEQEYRVIKRDFRTEIRRLLESGRSLESIFKLMDRRRRSGTALRDRFLMDVVPVVFGAETGFLVEFPDEIWTVTDRSPRSREFLESMARIRPSEKKKDRDARGETVLERASPADERLFTRFDKRFESVKEFLRKAQIKQAWDRAHERHDVKSDIEIPYESLPEEQGEVDFEPYLDAWIGKLTRRNETLLDPEKAYYFARDFTYAGPADLARRIRGLLDDLEGTAAALEPAVSPEEIEVLGTPEIIEALRGHGFAPGWGRNLALVRERLKALEQALQNAARGETAPALETLRELENALPSVWHIDILSPHGYFAQTDVFGFPDTGGQVTYILDQVPAMERELRRKLEEAGIPEQPLIKIITRLLPETRGTRSDLEIEPVLGARSSYILRIPFEENRYAPLSSALYTRLKRFEKKGYRLETLSRAVESVIPFVRRFENWFYHGKFIESVSRASTRFARARGYRGAPDFILGNYSDGNRVASALAGIHGRPWAMIAHALELSKYPQSDRKWFRVEDGEFLAGQHAVDTLAMNDANFIIHSSMPELEQYALFSRDSGHEIDVTGLFHIANDIKIGDARFRKIPPGVRRDFFPPDARDESGRLKRGDFSNERAKWEKEIFEDTDPLFEKPLENPSKPPLFTMARLDSVKNIVGLVQAFAESDLPEDFNLVIVAGNPNDLLEGAERTMNQEEWDLANDIRDIVLARPELKGKIRWLPASKVPRESAEIYRVIADRNGVFVQPAILEAFGLTVLEAQACGLPVFAHGNPRGGMFETVKHGETGFHFHIEDDSPEHRAGDIAETIRAVFPKGFSRGMDLEAPYRFADPAVTGAVSRVREGAFRQLREIYNWNVHARQVLAEAERYATLLGMDSYVQNLARRRRSLAPLKRLIAFFEEKMLVYLHLLEPMEPRDQVRMLIDRVRRDLSVHAAA